MPEKNGRAAVELIRGVRILSAPDAAGDFDFERSTQQIGEAVSETFLAPHRREDRLVSAGCDSPTGVSADPDPRQGDDAFLADIVAAAQGFWLQTSAEPATMNRGCGGCGNSFRDLTGQTCWIADSSHSLPRRRTKVHISSASVGVRGSPLTM